MGRTLSDSLLTGSSAFVATRLGLNFPPERWADLDRGLAAAARDLGYPNAEACARSFLSEPSTRNQIEVLASHLTVGETYFFRERQTLDIFEQQIVPELVSSRAPGHRHLRIWSAGCCTGEEPYSIAMLLDRLLPDPASWNLTILATDINPSFLRRAAEGVYREWSFRATPGWIRDRYFSKRGRGRFELQPHIRRRVKFSYLNLAEDDYPSLLTNTSAMDVIFCRNVLMYFRPERAKVVVGNLYRSLVDGGCLIVSPIDASHALFSSFSAIRHSGGVYRKTASAESALPEDSHADRELAVPPISEKGHRRGKRVRDPARKETRPRSSRLSGDRSSVSESPSNPEAGALAEHARRCANHGRLAEAVQWAEQAVAADKMNPASHYLLATIRQELGEIAAAETSLSRALYLDPGYKLAHFALANIASTRESRETSERHFRNALATLRAYAQNEILPESDGLTAGRLAQIIESLMKSLPHRRFAEPRTGSR